MGKGERAVLVTPSRLGGKTKRAGEINPLIAQGMHAPSETDPQASAYSANSTTSAGDVVFEATGMG